MKARIILVLVAVLCVIGSWTGLSFYRYATTPQQSSGAAVAVWIKPGDSFAETVVQLQEAGIVRRPKMFRWLAYLKGYERRIRAGEYLLRRSMAPMATLEVLVRGKALLHKVVVPEGSTIVRIGQILETEGLVSQKTFLEKASDTSFTQALGVEGDTFEGYLFPETYLFPKGVSAEKIIRTMVSHFRSIFTPVWAERAGEMGLSAHEVVTLASIVEKETAKPEERPLIAAVFLNRLRLGMGLESDPTVIYGIEGFDGNLTRKDLETPT
ncbi:MAG: endolytic transglycosylase MltG, partial [Thermodesulfobacteriota bacterium]|nr:endolytic transglycosylase MltG [Thermodesulfobacteriota bacterium]